jgi:ABC-type glutathione transport system ATPase component
MLIFDTVLYTVLAFYLELVLPKEFGTRMHPLFMCHKRFWVECCGGDVTALKDDDAIAPIVPQAPVGKYATEPLGRADLQLQAEQKGVHITGLRKEFSTPDGTLVAVDNLHLTMVEGQIFALLGHNGAGKTTTINMLNGIYKPTGGDALVYGKSVVDEMDKIRHTIGNCFQVGAAQI